MIELESFLLADPVFFDAASGADRDTTVFGQLHEPVPDGWRREVGDVWVEYVPPGVTLPAQGWKVHVSACPDNAERVLSTTFDYCVAAGVQFKFLRGRHTLRAHSLKYADRSASGKLVTIYPADTTACGTVLAELSALLDGEPGPYILTDLRYGDGPLYVRYGGFALRHCPGENGELVPALAQPDGTLVPDRRAPVFSVPEWVEIPDFLAPHVAARQQAADTDFPYQPEHALHFSNGGGVYLARRTTDGQQVVLKEGRPYAGLDDADRDAVVRLRAERDALQRLAGIPGVPALYEYRTVWEHEFLVQEYRAGDSLFHWLSEHHPLVTADPSDARVQQYTARARHIVDQVEQLVAAVHDRGMAIGDLHPGNVLVDGEDTVSLIDFEVARDAAAPARTTLGFPGFVHPRYTGTDADRYAVAALKLWIFLPITELHALAPDKSAALIDAVARRFPLPAEYVDAMRDALVPQGRPAGPVSAHAEVDLTDPARDWTLARKSLVEAILQTATPHRPDRLFPGDPRQLTEPDVNAAAGFGYGAAGVLWALDMAGAGRHPHLEQWLLDTVPRLSSVRPGFYDGLYGVAYVLHHLGHHAPAATVLAQAVAATPDIPGVTLHSGLAGAGLALQNVGPALGGDTAGLVDTVATRLADAVTSGAAHGVDEVTGRSGHAVAHFGSKAGLLRGWSGPALFFLRRWQQTADPAALDLAVTCLHRDLDLCREAPDGSLQVDAGYALLPYLEVGSAGIALVAAEVLAHRADDRVSTALPLLARACRPELVVEAQLLFGRAGLLAATARLDAQRPDLALGDAVTRHLDRLGWHALAHHEHLAFPGAKLRRLSMDLGTGNAGVLLALDAAVDGVTGFLPFLDRPEPTGG